MRTLRFGVPIGALCLLLTLAAEGPVFAAQKPVAERPTADAGSAVVPIDLNRADIDDLVAVPGIGPATAQRIVAFRDEHGPFRRVEDLLKIQGIGEKSLEKLRPYLKVSEPS